MLYLKAETLKEPYNHIITHYTKKAIYLKTNRSRDFNLM